MRRCVAGEELAAEPLGLVTLASVTPPTRRLHLLSPTHHSNNAYMPLCRIARCAGTAPLSVGPATDVQPYNFGNSEVVQGKREKGKG